MVRLTFFIKVTDRAVSKKIKGFKAENTLKITREMWYNKQYD